MTQIEKMQLNRYVDKILKTPGNVVSGQQLEMAFVLDCSCNKEYLKPMLCDTVAALKAHDKIFQNVRSNVVYWGGDRGLPSEEQSDRNIITKTMPMSFLQMGKPFEQEGYFDNLVCECEENKVIVENIPIFDELCAYLKMYHARSKCILVFTGQNYKVENKKKVLECLNPFLKTKMLVITMEKMIPGTIIHMEMIR